MTRAPLRWTRSLRGFLLAGCALAGWVVGAPAENRAGATRVLDAGGGLTLADGTRSMFHHPMVPAAPSARAKQAGAAVLRQFEGDPTGCPEALAIYDEISKVDNFGGEYGALAWTCAYLQAGEERRAELAGAPEAKRFLTVVQAEGWRRFRDYLGFKYGLTTEPPGPEATWFDAFVRTSSPARGAEERADQIDRVVAARPGMTIVDVGAASGFYTFRWAEAVGRAGRVHALESDPLHGEYLRNIASAEGLEQIVVQRFDETSLGLDPGSADVIFMCNTFQRVYGSVRSGQRERWISSLRSTLRPGGRVVLVENLPDDELGTHPAPAGAALNADLVIAQLEAYGFRLRAKHRFIPQQVVLEFDGAA